MNRPLSCTRNSSRSSNMPAEQKFQLWFNPRGVADDISALSWLISRPFYYTKTAKTTETTRLTLTIQLSCPFIACLVGVLQALRVFWLERIERVWPSNPNTQACKHANRETYRARGREGGRKAGKEGPVSARRVVSRKLFFFLLYLYLQKLCFTCSKYQTCWLAQEQYWFWN